MLFDTSVEPLDLPGAPTAWVPQPTPTAAQLLAQALLERSIVPSEIIRGLRAVLRAPRRAATAAAERLAELGAFAWAGLEPAPHTPYNVEIGPHRRYDWVDADLATFKQIKDVVGGTVNDAVLTVVAGALGRHLRARGHHTAGLELRALVPVSVRLSEQAHEAGNHVAAVWAPLPVGETDPLAALRRVHGAMEHVKATHEAVGAQTLTELTDFAPPTLMSQAARLQARQRLFNVVVTNVPGPQFPLYLRGPPADLDLPGRAAGRQPGDRHRRAQLRRGAGVRAARRPRRGARPGRARPAAARVDRRAGCGSRRAPGPPAPVPGPHGQRTLHQGARLDMRRVLAGLLAVVLATAGAVGILLALQSRDDGTIDRPPPASTAQTLP